MIRYRKNLNWKPIHISVDIKDLNEMEKKVEDAVKANIPKSHLKRKWIAIDIVDVQIISSTFQPTKDTTFLDLLVFVVDLTGELIDE